MNSNDNIQGAVLIKMLSNMTIPADALAPFQVSSRHDMDSVRKAGSWLPGDQMLENIRALGDNTMPTDTLAPKVARALAGMVLTPVARIFHQQHQKIWPPERQEPAFLPEQISVKF